MSLRTAALFLHVLAGVVLLGHSLGTPLVLAAIRETPTAGALRPWLRFARDSARLNPLAALVLLASGLWLGSGRWREGWLLVACALFVVSTALAVGVVKATGERVAALAAAAGDEPIPPALDALRRSRRWTLGADALLAADLAALVLMFAQPGLLGSIAVAAAATAAVLGLRAARGRKAAAGAAIPGVA